MLDTGAAIAELRRRTLPSDGYDYYHTLYSAVRLYALTKDEGESRSVILRASRESERGNNLKAFDNFLDRFGGSRTLEPVSLPLSNAQMILEASPKILIRVDPIFSVREKEDSQVYCIYATKSPSLSQKYGAIGCYIQRMLLRKTALNNSSFCMFDAAQKKKFSERQITDMTPQIFRSDVRRLSADIEDIES